jgi:hypothetical protein
MKPWMITTLVLVFMTGCYAGKVRPRSITFEEDRFGRWVITNPRFADWISSHCKIRQTPNLGHPVDPAVTPLYLECHPDTPGIAY